MPKFGRAAQQQLLPERWNQRHTCVIFTQAVSAMTKPLPLCDVALAQMFVGGEQSILHRVFGSSALPGSPQTLLQGDGGRLDT